MTSLESSSLEVGDASDGNIDESIFSKRESASLHSPATSHALIADAYVYAFGISPSVFIKSINLSATVHSPEVLQAAIALLQTIVSRGIFLDFIFERRRSASFQQPALAHADIALE